MLAANDAIRDLDLDPTLDQRLLGDFS